MAEFRYTTLGPGDAATWGPCTDHPGDPRRPEVFDDEACPECGSRDLQEIDMGTQCAECGAVFDA